MKQWFLDVKNQSRELSSNGHKLESVYNTRLKQKPMFLYTSEEINGEKNMHRHNRASAFTLGIPRLAYLTLLFKLYIYLAKKTIVCHLF